jgi:hypothetical protein
MTAMPTLLYNDMSLGLCRSRHHCKKLNCYFKLTKISNVRSLKRFTESSEESDETPKLLSHKQVLQIPHARCGLYYLNKLKAYF